MLLKGGTKTQHLYAVSPTNLWMLCILRIERIAQYDPRAKFELRPISSAAGAPRLRPRWPLCKQAQLPLQHNTPSLLPFYEYLRTAYERADNGERVEGRKEVWGCPQPLWELSGWGRATRRHPGLSYDSVAHCAGLSYRILGGGTYCGRRQWVAGGDTHSQRSRIVGAV